MRYLDLVMKPDRNSRETWLVNYIRDTGKLMEIPYETLDIGPLITIDGPSNSPNDVNKFLFNSLQEIKAPVKVKLTAQQRDRLKRLNIYFNHSGSVDAYRTEVVRASNNLAQKIRELDDEMRRVNGLAKTSPIVEVQKIIDATGWTLTNDIGEGFIGFVTKEIKCVDENTEWVAELGKYKIQFSPWNDLSNGLIVKPSENNVSFHNHIHPFIGSANHICWGDSITEASFLWGKRDWVGICMLLQELLVTYRGVPYVTLIDLTINSRTVDRRMAWQKAVIEKYFPEAIDRDCICDESDCDLCNPVDDEPELEVEDGSF